MKVLFDQCTPVPLRRYLHPHTVDTAAERGWSRLQNGQLLDQIESDHYDAFITTDTKLKYQQNLAKRTIRVLALTSTSWPRIHKKTDQIRAALEALVEGGYVEVEI
jgi:hypothetical protein